MTQILLYRTLTPLGYIVVDNGYGLDNLPKDAELILSPSTDTREEALTEIDRFLGHPPYLDVRRKFQAGIATGLPYSETVRKVHLEIGEVSGGVWPDHFWDVLGISKSDMASLFVVWWPTGITEMSDEEFDERVRALIQQR